MKYDIIFKGFYCIGGALESFFEMKYDIIMLGRLQQLPKLESFFEMKYDIIDFNCVGFIN